MSNSAAETRPFIGGQSKPAAGGETLDLTDPATSEAVAHVAAGTDRDIDAAVASARETIAEWQGIATEARGEGLRKLTNAIREREDERTTLEMRDTGKPISQARNGVQSRARYFEYYAGIADKIRGDSIPVGDGYVDYTVREPLGVTGHIIPWNFPLNILGRTIAPALAAGNTVVVKPDERTPRTAVEVANSRSGRDTTTRMSARWSRKPNSTACGTTSRSVEPRPATRSSAASHSTAPGTSSNRLFSTMSTTGVGSHRRRSSVRYSP